MADIQGTVTSVGVISATISIGKGDKGDKGDGRDYVITEKDYEAIAKIATSDLVTHLKSGKIEDADYHLGFYINEDGKLCQKED